MDKSTIAALQGALAGEHAALWGYGQVGALALSTRLGEIRAVEQQHRVRRDAVEELLVQAEAAPVPSASAYTLPEPITDAESGLAVAALIEDGVAAAWRFVLGQTEDATVRKFALTALIGAAKQALRWRTVIEQAPLTRAFPGLT